MIYLRCRECRDIHRQGALSREWVPGTLSLLGYCPTCGCDRFDEVKDVCDLCEKEIAAPNDDYCAPCGVLVTREEDDFFADNEQEPDFWRKVS